ncbi:FGGY family carbohydrate kinase [Coriobacterium glomerans]|nr:glycerol kinase GlpK [Coriobacterium glomerans]
MARYIIGIDQSTQGTKALLLDERGTLIRRVDRPHRQIVSDSGWISHDPREIARNVIRSSRDVVLAEGIPLGEVAGIGISNQRETTVAWDARTGEPLCDAVVWQCARASEICARIKAKEGASEMVRARSGLPLSPYYPASKMAWILENVSSASEAARSGSLRMGTVDSWIIWVLTHGTAFLCDHSNASRTQLFDIAALGWSQELCSLFGIDESCLPAVTDSDACFGYTDLEGFLPTPIPIHAALGDSHAALFGQGCLKRGMAKATYGTGASVMLNVGARPIASAHGLSTSIGWRMGATETYVIEGNINYAGAVNTWLRDDLGLIDAPSEVEALCRSASRASRVYLVPAFSGLGAPHWCDRAQAAILGMERSTHRAELVCAANESIAYQIADVVDAMREDAGIVLSELRVDGGPTANGYLMQFQSDVLATPLRVAKNDEMSGMGAAWCAGVSLDIYGRDVAVDSAPRARFEPKMRPDERQSRIAGWRRALATTIGYARD